MATNNKLSFIQFDSFSNDFQTLALYALDSSNLNGKLFSENFLEIYSSLSSNYIIYTYNDNKLNIIKSLNPGKPLKLNDIEKQELYYDTLKGDEFFEPSLCLNLEEKSGLNYAICPRRDPHRAAVPALLRAHHHARGAGRRLAGHAGGEKARL